MTEMTEMKVNTDSCRQFPSKRDLKETWEPAPIHIQVGDIITSKKGLLYFSNLTGKKEFYRAYKVKYLGNCGWEVTGRKEPVADVTAKAPGGENGRGSSSTIP